MNTLKGPVKHYWCASGEFTIQVLMRGSGLLIPGMGRQLEDFILYAVQCVLRNKLKGQSHSYQHHYIIFHGKELALTCLSGRNHHI